MRTYILRRLLAVIPTLLFASLIVFGSMRLIPGDVIDLMLAQNDIATDQDRAKIEAALGFDKPVHEQYVTWLGNALTGDFGRSLWQNTPVAEQLGDALPITFELGLLALIVSVISMLSDPNDESPANLDAAVMFRNDQAAFKKKVRQIVRKTQEDF